jgi:hypothetical protein
MGKYVGVLISVWLFLFPTFLFAAQTKEFFLDGLNKLEQRSHKCVELRGEYVELIFFFNPIACCFLYKAKDLSAPPPRTADPKRFAGHMLYIEGGMTDGGALKLVLEVCCEDANWI